MRRRVQDRPAAPVWGSPAGRRRLVAPSVRIGPRAKAAGGILAGTMVALGAGAGIVALIPDPIHQGTVVSRDYDDPDTWTTLEPVYGPPTCVTSGYGSSKTTICNNPIIGMVPQTWHDGPHWNLKLQADSDGRTGWREVDQATFEAHQLGSHFDDGYREPSK